MRRRFVEGVPLDVRARRVGPVVGVEHEYRVLRGDEQIDFECVLRGLRPDGLRLDPTDPHAYRTAWGGLLTSDGREAEVATAPVALRPGCTSELVWRTAVAQHALTTVLPDDLHLDGYSTHLNLEIDDRDVVAAGRLFTRRFAPAMMLLLDRPSSPGLLVRPRCARLELGGEYCNGDHLRAATTFAAAAGLACAAAARDGATRRHLPRPVRVRVRPSNIRAGWYIDRRAFGVDLYDGGRAAVLRDHRHRSWRAQDHLVDTWTCSRPFVEQLLDHDELLLVDQVVDGTLALPLEGDLPNHDPAGPFPDDAFASALRRRRRPRFSIEPVSMAWSAVAFALHGHRDAIACIPRVVLAEFLDALDAGQLDATIASFLASPPQGRVLRDSTQTARPGLFDELATPHAVAPPERVPGRRLGNRGGGTPRDSRRDKHRRARGPRRALLVAGAVVLVAVIAAVVLLTRDDTETVSSTGLTGIPPGAVPVRFNVDFTVDQVTVGPHYTGEPVPTVGSHSTLAVQAACSTTCAFGDTGSASSASAPFVDLGLPFRQTASDFLRASADSSDSSSPCRRISTVHEEATVQLERDGAGKITGFRGAFRVTHPGGVEETTASGTCSTFDISYSFVGTPA